MFELNEPSGKSKIESSVSVDLTNLELKTSENKSNENAINLNEPKRAPTLDELGYNFEVGM